MIYVYICQPKRLFFSRTAKFITTENKRMFIFFCRNVWRNNARFRATKIQVLF